MKYTFFFLLTISFQLSAQSPYVLPGTLTDDIADRWDILYDFDHAVFSSQRNTSRKEITKRAWNLKGNKGLSKVEAWDIDYILSDNTEYKQSLFINDSPDDYNTINRQRVYDSTGVFYYLDEVNLESQNELTNQKTNNRIGIFKYLYRTKANFFEINKEDFSIRLNPILNLRFSNASNDENTIFQNTRGAEIKGLIDKKVYFYTSIFENQARFNNYIETRITKFQSIPGQGLYKDYKSGVIESLQGYDYLNAQAYVGINATKSVAIEFGHGKHFIGNGIRSLLLSNYANNYFYLKFNTRIWKLHYQNVFAELAPISSTQNPSDRLLPKKYMANHYLSVKPTKNIEIGVFESVVFARENQFEFQYLNPIILYRTVEQFLDSPDNVLIGLNAKWNIKHRVQLYGQLILDEFKLAELSGGNGWWANKYGIQAGIKYINVLGIDHLDMQLEYNRVRPYTYAHRDSLENFPLQSNASYSHFNMPLAHPLGANFKEVVLHLKYRPSSRLHFNARIVSANYGQDVGDEHNGGNILLITDLRLSATGNKDTGHEIGQGVNTNLTLFSFDMSYRFAHNYYLDFNTLYRKSDADLDALDIDTKYIGAGIRVNVSNYNWDY